MDYTLILRTAYPDAAWAMTGNDPSTLQWFSDGTPPTTEELDALWPSVQATENARLVDADRYAAYAAEADPLFFKWQRGEGTEAEWLAKVEEIRQRYPKPAT